MNFAFDLHSEAKLPIDSISLSITAELGRNGGGGFCVSCQNLRGKNRSAVTTAAHNSELIDSVVGVRGDVSACILPAHRLDTGRGHRAMARAAYTF